MKKIFIGLLCCLMLSGCGGNSGSSTKDSDKKETTKTEEKTKNKVDPNEQIIGKKLKNMAPNPEDYLSGDEYVSESYAEKGDKYYTYQYTIDKCNTNDFYTKYTNAVKQVELLNGTVEEDRDDDQYSFDIYSSDNVYSIEVFWYAPDDINDEGDVSIYIYQTIESVK